MVRSTNSTPRNHQDQMPQANFAATPAFVHALPGVPYHPEAPSVPSITGCRLLSSLRADGEHDQRSSSGANGSLSIWARLGSCQAHNLLHSLLSFRCLHEATAS